MNVAATGGDRHVRRRQDRLIVIPGIMASVFIGITLMIAHHRGHAPHAAGLRMRTPADDPRYQPGNGRPGRPYPHSYEPSELADSKVKKLRRILRQSGVVDLIEAQFAELPGRAMSSRPTR